MGRICVRTYCCFGVDRAVFSGSFRLHGSSDPSLPSIWDYSSLLSAQPATGSRAQVTPPPSFPSSRDYSLIHSTSVGDWHFCFCFRLFYSLFCSFDCPATDYKDQVVLELRVLLALLLTVGIKGHHPWLGLVFLIFICLECSDTEGSVVMQTNYCYVSSNR